MSKRFPEHPILIVDDERNHLQSVEMMLLIEGIDNLVLCSDGRQAVSIIDAGTFSLFLVDLNMPYVSGEDLIQRIKRRQPGVPIIIISAKQDIRFAVESLKNDVVDYLVKPVDTYHLVESIRRGIRLSDARSRSHLLQEFLLAQNATPERSVGTQDDHPISHILEEVRREYAALYHSVPVPMIMVDRTTLRIVTCNRSALELFAWSVETTVDVPITDLLPLDETFLQASSSSPNGAGEDIDGGNADPGAEHRKYVQVSRADGTTLPLVVTAERHGDSTLTYLSFVEAPSGTAETDEARRITEEKSVLLQEIDHRVHNNLQMILSLLSLQEAAVPEGAPKEAIQKVQDRVMSMYLGYSLVDLSVHPQRLDADQHITMIVKQLLRTYETLASRVHVDISVRDIFVRVDQMVVFGIVVNELLSNSMEHAFPPSFTDRPLISISSRWIDPRNAELMFTDNGTGFTAENSSASPLGLQLAKALVVDQLHGEFSLTTNAGTSCSVILDERTLILPDG